MTPFVPRPSMFLRALFGLSLVIQLAGCACSTNVGSDEADGGLDARRPAAGAYDECGNGLDDDGDGEIDEDCSCGTGEVQPCWDGIRAQRGVGECGDGEQRCSATGSNEFGRWLECTSTRGPGTERCDGSGDEDCDGAIDEGCTPCDEGSTRDCGVEFVIAPCTAGTQTCRGGAWSTCEGAIGPSAEVCGNGTDDDCDGEIDDATFCGCSPVPEICGNGTDDDCDGATDELPCGGGGDAGVPDAGSCTRHVCAASECGVIDDACGGTIDCGACPVTCGPTLERVASLPGALVDAFTMSGGTLYALFDTSSGTTIRAIDPHDWSARVVQDAGTYVPHQSFAVDGERLCFATATGGVRCGPLAGPYDALPLPSGMTSAMSAVAIGGEDVYWMADADAGPPTRLALLRTTAGTTTELWRSDAFGDGATVLSANRQIFADPSGVTVVLADIHFLHYPNSAGGESGATGAFSSDGTHEHVTRFTRDGARSGRWDSGPVPMIPEPERARTHWDLVLATLGGARDGTSLFWAESAEAWGITSEVSMSLAASPPNPLRLRTRSLEGAEAAATLIDDAAATRRSVFFVHPTRGHVYVMTYVYAGTDVTESRLERVARSGGALETVASIPTATTPLRALSAVTQIGDCLVVGIRRGNFDSEIHTIRVD
ncbi:MAG: hypothetical protein K1X94_29730 [Sandaracinaceae bacterium]|nr:hypothetical protein [Sandaracinaceae bacterium]